MEVENIYKDPELNLNKLAETLTINTRDLTKLINTVFNRNFSDYVNTYRIESVKQILKSQADNHLSLLGIGLEAGFNSKASFNRTFKKFTGLSPVQFKNAVLEKAS